MDWLRRLFGGSRESAAPVPAQAAQPEWPPSDQPLQRQIQALLAQYDALKDSRRDLARAAWDRHIELSNILGDRITQGIALERARREAEAIPLYEACVADEFDGSHPYERLLRFYSYAARPDDERRIAAACLRLCTGGIPDKLRAKCQKALGPNRPT